MRIKKTLLMVSAILAVFFTYPMEAKAQNYTKLTWTSIASTASLVTTSHTIVYNGCYENTSLLTMMQIIPSGSVVSVNAYCKTPANGLWYKVTFNGITGYCLRESLSPVFDWTLVKKCLLDASNGHMEIFTDDQVISYLAGTLCPPGLTPMQKAKNVHDYLCMNMEYDYSFAALTTHKALFDGIGVCQAYANAFCEIMNKAGVPTDFVGGVAINKNGTLEDHAWNRCLIGNTYYYIDTTWDDEGNLAGNEFFWTTDRTFGQTHVETCIDPYRKK